MDVWERWRPGVVFLLRRKLDATQVDAATREVRQIILAHAATGGTAAGDELAAFVRSAVQGVVRTRAAQGSAVQAAPIETRHSRQVDEIASVLRRLNDSELRLLSSIYLGGASPRDASEEHGFTEMQLLGLKRRLRSCYERCAPQARVAV